MARSLISWWKQDTAQNKSVLVSIFLVVYGAFAAPVYWLRSPSLRNFNSLVALYVVFGVLTFVLVALLNIYIPHCMRHAKAKARNAATPSAADSARKKYDSDHKAAQKYGFSMSIFGIFASALSGALMLVIVIIITQTVSRPHQQSAGLLVTSIIGFVTMVGAIGSYLGLPALSAKSYPAVGGWKTVLLELSTPYREMFLRKRNMLFLLLGFTIYTDTLFAVFSITRQLYYIENRWEFYVHLLISYISESVVNPSLRILFSELVPKGEEIMWFGLQLILNCATTWVNYVATAPLQNATHNLRYPLVLCLVFAIVPVVLECMRATMAVFKKERALWLRESNANECSVDLAIKTPHSGKSTESE
ncbi:MAG: hypothetical protein Q9218_006474 [Villophora microphyllina]